MVEEADLLRKIRVPWVLYVLAIIGPILGLFGFAAGWLDLFSHFRLQYLLILLLLIPLLIWQQQRKALVPVLVILTVFGGHLLWEYPLSRPAVARPSHGPELTILYANVNVNNPNHAAILHMIRQQQPDILVISEIDEPLHAKMKPLLKDYPDWKVMTRDDCFGLGVFSRIPFDSLELENLGTAQLPSMRAVLSRPAGKVEIWATHPIPPIPGQQSAWHLDHIQVLARRLAAAVGPKIVVGDLNTTPWSARFHILKQAGMVDTARGSGLVPTWPTVFPRIFRIPLDYVLVSQDVLVLDHQVLPPIGSDHLPVLVRLAL